VTDKSPLETIIDERVPSGLGGRWYGVYPALVTDVKGDPDGLGRVKVTLPWVADTGDGRYEVWARVATLMAGNNRGSWFIPDQNDEVLIAFEGGDPRRPYVLGGLWNGKDKPPETMDRAGKNAKKVLRSRNGVKVTLEDSDGRERLILETPGGQTITLKDGPGAIELVDSNGNSLKLQASGVFIESAGKVSINASQFEVTAATVQVNSGASQFSGIVQAPTVIATSVVASTYTPGAGNIL
jgi:uncharacterized protein involved in type VI secretion and phage assembly